MFLVRSWYVIIPGWRGEQIQSPTGHRRDLNPGRTDVFHNAVNCHRLRYSKAVIFFIGIVFHRDTGNDCTLETCEVVVARKLYELNPRRKYLQHKVGNHHRCIARLLGLWSRQVPTGSVGRGGHFRILASMCFFFRFLPPPLS